MKKTIEEIVREFSEKLPKFPDGRIDYSTSNSAPVIIIFVMVGKEILLLRRSTKVFAYQGKWSANAGFLDNEKPIQEKVTEELIDELGITEERLAWLITEIKICEYYEFRDEKSGKTWIKNPVLVRLKEKPSIVLDWEHDRFRWIEVDELAKFDTVIDLENALERALN
ncbi:MAG: NUDIX domain-containing protein [Candidatus Pacebacteria bacterium]|nr:NUDIX domain-containing protein [Candidatus Paceibacterota bacterium]